MAAKTNRRRFASYYGAGVVNAIGAPENSVAPTITGTAKVGQTLTSTPGTWSGAPTYTRVWRAGGAVVPGATGATYVPVTGDIGKAITVTVTATNDRGKNSVNSAATASVVA